MSMLGDDHNGSMLEHKDGPAEVGDVVEVLLPDGSRKLKTITEIEDPCPVSRHLFGHTRTHKTDDGKTVSHGIDGVGWFEPSKDGYVGGPPNPDRE